MKYSLWLLSLCDLRVSNMDFDLIVNCAWSFCLGVSSLDVCGNVQMNYYLYILRGFKKLIMTSKNVKNTYNLIR